MYTNVKVQIEFKNWSYKYTLEQNPGQIWIPTGACIIFCRDFVTLFWYGPIIIFTGHCRRNIKHVKTRHDVNNYVYYWYSVHTKHTQDTSYRTKRDYKRCFR